MVRLWCAHGEQRAQQPWQLGSQRGAHRRGWFGLGFELGLGLGLGLARQPARLASSAPRATCSIASRNTVERGAHSAHSPSASLASAATPPPPPPAAAAAAASAPAGAVSAARSTSGGREVSWLGLRLGLGLGLGLGSG